MKRGSIIEVFLQRQRRRSRGTLLAWAAAAAVAGPAWDGAVRLGWIAESAYWALVPAAAAAYLLVRWSRRVWRLDQRALAQEFDARWELKARIESAVELSESDSAMTLAQRADVEQRLGSKKPVGTIGWLGGIAAMVIGLGTVGLEQAVIYRRAHQPPPPSAAAVAAVKPAPTLQAAPPPPEPLRASIAWMSPARSIQAKAAGAIPLVAHAESNKGFRSASLEVALNGAHTNSYPVAAAALGTLAQPGEGALKLSLFLDETGAKPYDIVSYYVQAEANFPPAFPAVLSPQQFVEVLPADATPAGDERYPPDAREMLRRLEALKQAQLRLIDQNFTLIHSDPSGIALNGPTNAEVASAQSQLAQTTDEARAFAVRTGAPPLIATDLAQAAPLMTQAGAQIAAQANAAAAPLQAQALSRLADTERAFRQALQAKSPAAPPGSFKAQHPAALKPRGETPAGHLEQLARRQSENNRRLENAPPGSPEYSAAADEQAAIARDARKLAAEHALVAPAQSPLDAAAKAAAEAARQLGLNDAEAAREPAAQAQVSLQHALDVQESEGRKAAAAVLEQVRQELNDADRLKDQAAKQAQQEQARHELSAEAERQQEQGSAEAAKKLDALANQMGGSETKPSSPRPPPSGAQPPQAPKPPTAEDDSPPPPAMTAMPGQPGSGAPEDPPAHLFIANLQPLPGGPASRASGRATILLGTGYLTARVDVTFEHLASEEVAAKLAIGGTGEKGTVVLSLSPGQVTHKFWDLKPSGNLSRASLMTALESGNLYVEIDTATAAQGELGGAFLPKGNGSGGGGSGSGSSSGSGSASGTSQNGGKLGEGDQGAKQPTTGHGGGRSSSAPGSIPPAMDDNVQEVPQGSLIDASVTAAETEAALAPDSALAQTIRQLKSAAARIGSPEGGSSSLSMLELAAQEARWLTGDPGLTGSAQSIAEGAGGDLHGRALDPAERKALAERALKLAQALELAQSVARRDEWVRRFAPEDIDPDYRKPVEDYFENLSREGATR